jgi:hypothetical protein
MKNNIIKYLACAAVALGLAATVQGAAITGGVTFNGSFTYDTGGGDLSLANTLRITAGPSPFSLSGSGAGTTFFGATEANLVSFYSVYNVYHPITTVGVPPNLSPSGNQMWQLLYGGVNYFFTVTSEVQTWNAGSHTLGMSGLGTFSADNGAPSVSGTWQINWGQSGDAQFGFSGTDAVGQPRVPDGGLTIILLGMALSGLALIRRKLA